LLHLTFFRKVLIPETGSVGDVFKGSVDIYAWDKDSGEFYCYKCSFLTFSIVQGLTTAGNSTLVDEQSPRKPKTYVIETLRKFKTGALNLPCVLEELFDEPEKDIRHNNESYWRSIL
jgi:hypothetical protein